MSLLDQLRQKWKHSDPAVRLEGVRQLEDQGVLESLAESDPDERVRLAALPRLTNQSAIARIAQHAESAAVRQAAVNRIDDRAVLLKISTVDLSATVRAHARARCSDNSGGSHLKEVLGKLQVAGLKPGQGVEFSGTLGEVCDALRKDLRYFINGDVAPDEEDSGTAQLRDNTQVAWTRPSVRTNRTVAHFVAQARNSEGTAPDVSGPTHFYYIKVWRTGENRFDFQAVEKQFAATRDASAWSNAASGGPFTLPPIEPAAPTLPHTP